MASFFSFLKTNKFPVIQKVRALLRGPLTFFSALFYAIFFLLCLSIFILVVTLNNKIVVTVPAGGGTLTEGVIGAPRFINPLLATTPTDQRLVTLIYGSLMTANADGSSSPSLAQSYTISPDGLTYTFVLPPKAFFDDGKPLTSDDVAFTVAKLQDSDISSTSDYWENITVATPDPQTVVFSLPAADTSFLSRTDFGILPKHIWENVTDEQFSSAIQNVHPVGAGVMKVADVDYQNNIVSSVSLVRNKYFTGTKPLLAGLTIKSFANQTDLLNALNNGTVDFSYDVTSTTLGTSPLASDLTATAIPTDETVSIYRSSADTTLSSGTTVTALNQMIDKNAIIATVLDGYGTPAGTLPDSAAISPKVANTIKGFSLAVENDPSLLLAAQTLSQQLAQYGIAVQVNAYDPGTFKNDIAGGLYTLFLARSDESGETIPPQYTSTIPLYTESLPYVFNTKTHTIPPAIFQSPIIEYETVQQWYTNTDKLWKWFIRKNNN